MFIATTVYPNFWWEELLKFFFLNFNDTLEKSGSLSNEIVIDNKYKTIKS